MNYKYLQTQIQSKNHFQFQIKIHKTKKLIIKLHIKFQKIKLKI